MEHPEEKEVETESYFVYTSDTKEADIPKETLTRLQVDSSVRAIPDNAFRNCRGLTHVQLPETLQRIGIRAFGRCVNLKCVQFGVSRNASMEIPSMNDKNLEEATIIMFPETMLQIGDEAFSFCKNLQKVIICSVSTTLGKLVFSDCHGLISVELPEELQVINLGLFAYCESLTTVRIPSSVIKIDEGAFCGCGSLTCFELPHGLLEIGESSFYACVSIKTLHIPSTVSSIGRGAFFYCIGLKHIKLPPTLKSIEPQLFKGCERLEYVTIPMAVEEIDDEAFSGCSSLSHIRIPPSVDKIGPRAFSNCSSLISIELPEGIPFGLDFSRCPALVNVAGPMLNEAMESTAVSLQHLKLGSVANGADDLNQKLKHRFENSPLINLCYYQSYHSSEDAMLQLRSLMEDDPLVAATQVDEFGMTPLHVLSLPQTPNLDMLLAVIDAGRSGHMVHSRDSFRCTPMDYLCMNRMPNSTQVIRRLFQTRYDQVLGLDLSWKSDMLQAVEEALAMDWSSRRREIGRIVGKYERKELLSLMELYLWKVKIDEVWSKKEQILADRQRCRIMSGAAIVIPLVVPFLDKLDMEDCFVGSQ